MVLNLKTEICSHKLKPCNARRNEKVLNSSNVGTNKDLNRRCHIHIRFQQWTKTVEIEKHLFSLHENVQYISTCIVMQREKCLRLPKKVHSKN